MKILYVSTRQWNPGDEFIMRGCRSIISALGIEESVCGLFNKSPQTTSLFEAQNIWKRPYFTSLFSAVDFAINITHYDNSFKRNHDINFFDTVVFAGSPEWYGPRLKLLFRKLREFKGAVVFLGIGIPPRRSLSLSNDEKAVIGKSLVFCRNPNLAKQLEEMGVQARYLPCPALLSSPFEREAPVSLKKVGLGFNTTKSHRYQRMSEEKFRAQKAIFDYMINNYDCEIIAHYSDELDEAANLYGSEKVRYAFDSVEYPSIYSAYDFVISSRVHGCGAASSVGVPNAAITHDARGDTVNGFLSERVSGLNDVEKLFDGLEETLRERHLALKEHKTTTLDAYVGALAHYLQ
ncbi:polysaccharide pyruvyl transferase family protein [Sagittula sp. MA-2]|jgi:hypothetical protein|uniref:polysaccharide pyruvyl transferase family protein n=1 Tax=Sagittula sp. MA-2 TaxID=3048007 RepID=UPI0024C3BDDA|nr:polysaccharide pyruvyl transferase family protein [Sagittula sp. MA-2]WHZ37725.1 polysaccharide pyruvyl transferase family protein [Sagittula sp. MA-2]